MKTGLLALLLLAAPLHAGSGTLDEKVWIHGSDDCRGSNRDPPIEVFTYDAATYVLRQNKCVHFEAPFIYVLFGTHTVFVQDTGATAQADRFPLYETILRLIAGRQAETTAPLHLLVTHSHSHGDHTAADAQFRNRGSGVTLIEPTAQAVKSHFGFAQWPQGQATVDLGGRTLIVMPAPGHQDESLAVFDEATGWLLTGDTVYPGRLYVKDWAAYQASIARLVEFSKTHRVSALMGTHIEMSASGRLFARGATFQPGEAPLPLPIDDLLRLNDALRRAGDEPAEIALDAFVVAPIGAFQRMLGAVLKTLSGR